MGWNATVRSHYGEWFALRQKQPAHKKSKRWKFSKLLVLISSYWEVIDIKYEVKRVIVRQYWGCLAWTFPLLSSSRRLFTCIRGKFGDDGDASLENRPAYLCQTNTPWQPVSPHRSSLVGVLSQSRVTNLPPLHNYKNPRMRNYIDSTRSLFWKRPHRRKEKGEK